MTIIYSSRLHSKGVVVNQGSRRVEDGEAGLRVQRETIHRSFLQLPQSREFP